MASKPKIYTLCGSSRFPGAFHLVNAHLSMQGHVVISLGLFGHADEPQGARFLTSDGDEQTPAKGSLDQLHFRKIDLADAIFVVNVGGYVGSSTKREIAYAAAHGKPVEWLFPPVPAEETGQRYEWFDTPLTGGVAAIAAERRRQIEEEGWTADHDDNKHSGGQLAIAAACYAISAGTHDENRHLLAEKRWNLYEGNLIVTAFYWLWSITIKWSSSWWKPSSRRRDLVKSGALIAAEIDRLDRLTARHQVEEARNV